MAPELFEMDPRFVRTCTFATMHTPGYGTRVTLSNGVGVDDSFATEFVVTMSAFARNGEHLGESGQLLTIEPGEIARIDVDSVLSGMVKQSGEPLRDVLGTLHLTPRRFVGEKTCQVSREELYKHLLATDDFVEYYSYDDTVVTGVAYQTGFLNDSRFSSTKTTVIQAPKVIVSDAVDTIFLLMNLSTSFDYDSDVDLRFKILGPNAELIVASSVTVPAFTFNLLSIRDLLEREGALDAFRAAGGLGTFFGLSQNGTVVPLSMTRNDQTGAIAVDHTLPPVFYVNQWGGEIRQQANARLAEVLFAPVPKVALTR